MTLLMPKPEEAILANRRVLVEKLRKILPAESVIADETGMRAYECDAFTMYRQLPMVVVLPQTLAQVSQITASLYRITGVATTAELGSRAATRW